MSKKGITRIYLSVLLSLAVSSATAAQFNLGDHINVAESSVNPSIVVQVHITGLSTGDITYSGGVYAGINQLLINGSEIVNGFCIDPFHFSSSSSLPYTVVDLTGAPKGHPMSDETATFIERLWGSFYSPMMSAQNAAGLQIAIWELVDPTGFSLASGQSDYGAGAMRSAVEVSGYTGPTANLVGLTGSGQDYVVQSVPDGGTTLSLLGLAMVALAAVKRQFRAC